MSLGCKCGRKLWNKPFENYKIGPFQGFKMAPLHKIETFWGARDIFCPHERKRGPFWGQKGWILEMAPFFDFLRVDFIMPRQIYSTGTLKVNNRSSRIQAASHWNLSNHPFRLYDACPPLRHPRYHPHCSTAGTTLFFTAIIGLLSRRWQRIFDTNVSQPMGKKVFHTCRPPQAISKLNRFESSCVA
jgi:hypothetical protein